MKKNNSFFVCLILYIIVIGILLIGSNSNKGCSSSPQTISKYEADVYLKPNGDMEVNEIVTTYGFEESFYHDISYRKFNSNNTEYYQSTSNVAFIDFNNSSIEVYNSKGEEITDKLFINKNETCDPLDYYCGSILAEVKESGDFDGIITFKYKYLIEKAGTKYTDISEINWVLFKTFSFAVPEVNITVNLPEGDYDLNDDFYVYCYGTSNGNWEKDIENKKVEIKARNLKQNEEVEFRILFPNAAYSLINEDSSNCVLNSGVNKKIILDYSEDLVKLDNKRILTASVIYYSSLFVVFLTIVFFIIIYIKYDKEYEPKFDLDHYRELPSPLTPAIMAFMYNFQNSKDEDLTATIMDLIRRGYLKLDENAQNIMDKDADFKIIRTDKGLEDLKEYESFIVKWFIDGIGNGECVTLKQIEEYPKKYQNAEKFQKNGMDFKKAIKKEASNFDFFEDVKNGKAKAMSFVIIPFALFLLFTFLGQSSNLDTTFAAISMVATTFFTFIYIGSIKKRSKNGIEEFAKWNAFKNFLTDFTALEEYTMPSIVIWEHYLVYAISFGIADKVMEQLRVKLPNIENEVKNTTFIGYGYYHRNYSFGMAINRINHSFQSARVNSMNTIASHNASSTGGRRGSGGFGGGSSFGGGGGGFRGR